MAESISNQVVRVCLCHRSFWDKNIHVLLQKLFNTNFSYFFVLSKFHASSILKKSEKILT